MKPLPAEIISKAFVADDGESAWQREHILTALKAILETGQAILGVDVWTVTDGRIQSLFPGIKGWKMWDTELQKPNELWSDYCLRTFQESTREIEKSQLENQIDPEYRQYIFYHPDYVEQNEIKALIPRNKHDLERAEAAVKAGYPDVEPILPELLEWLQDINWPVADVLAPFLASIGSPLIPHIQRIFETDDEIWKHWIINYIITESKELAIAFRSELERIAYSPKANESEEELDEVAQSALKQYGWEKTVS